MSPQSVETQIALLRQELQAMNKDIGEMQKDVSSIVLQAQRWKGMLAAVLGLGGLTITVLTLIEKLGNSFRG